MTVAELREALEKLPGHWPVHVAVRPNGPDVFADEEYLYTLECVPEAYPSQGNMAVVRVNYAPS